MTEFKTILEQRDKVFLCSSFSLQMLKEFNSTVRITEVEVDSEDLKRCISVVGHQDTANVLGVEFNRISVKLGKGDCALIAQLVSGRLPEGCTTLPEGFEFRFLLVEVE